MLKERLKEMDLRITELADYLQISRPTAYKFIDCYDSNNFDQINRKVLKLFNFITENELAGKKVVINYILNNLVELKELGSHEEQTTIKHIKNFVVSNHESKKAQFIELCCKSQQYDELIHYLVDIYPLLNKRKLTDEDAQLIKPYLEMKNLLPKN